MSNQSNSDETIPPKHRMQIGSYEFKFDIITSSKMFQHHLKHVVENDLVRDVTDPSLSEISEDEALKIPRSKYVNIVQKSPTWLYLRAQADGTASSVGKYIKGPTMYPTLEQIKQNWVDKVNKKPFEKTHTMLGHMNWGVGYEDPALIHLAIEEGVGVSQVGTIRVDLSYILKLGKAVFKDRMPPLKLHVDNSHLLISPDGIVGQPEAPNSVREDGVMQPRTDMYSKLLGMLEIKCMSPFYHIETDDHFLQWVDDIETRQWHKPQEIPFVYIVQMTLQAISGVQFYKMNERHWMWFIRWSPHGVSIFKMQFKYLVRMGILVSMLYFSLVQRTKTVEDIDKLYPLTDNESVVEAMMNTAYHDLMKNTRYRYVGIDDYPEFDTYNDCTKYFKFIISEMDSDSLQTDFNVKEENVTTSDLQSCLL